MKPYKDAIYKYSVIQHITLFTSNIVHTPVNENVYTDSIVQHVTLFTADIRNYQPAPEPPVLLEPIAGWTGYENCVLPPDLSKAVLIATLTGDYLVSTTEGKNLTEA
jgi:hypothetical protein